MDEVDIIREYRKKITDDKLFNWSDYLLKEKIFLKEHQDTKWGRCEVCGERIPERYIGSHFRQTGEKRTEHQIIVGNYERELKNIFQETLKKHGFKLKEKPGKYCENIWEQARVGVRSALYCWHEAVEKA